MYSWFGGGKGNTQTRARDWSRRCISRMTAGASVVYHLITLPCTPYFVPKVAFLPSLLCLPSAKRVFPGKLGDGESECLHSNMGEKTWIYDSCGRDWRPVPRHCGLFFFFKKKKRKTPFFFLTESRGSEPIRNKRLIRHSRLICDWLTGGRLSIATENERKLGTAKRLHADQDKDVHMYVCMYSDGFGIGSGLGLS